MIAKSTSFITNSQKINFERDNPREVCSFRVVLTFVVVFLFSIQLSAQQKKYNFDHITARDGFVSDVWSALRGSKGFMWFGTSTGLYRYDGKEFKVYLYDPDDTTTISGNVIEAPLFEDSSDILWIGTRANGLNSYDRITETFTHYRHNPEDTNSLCNNYVTTIYEDRKGILWVGTAHGLNKLNRETGMFTKYIQLPDLPNNNIDQIQTIYEDNRGNLYVGTTNGLFTLNRETGEFTFLDEVSKIPRDFRNIAFRDIVEGKNGILWLGTNSGLIRYNRIKNSIKRYHFDPNEPNSLHDNDIQKIEINPVDEGKTLWLSTTGGISKFDIENETFKGFTHDPDNPQGLGDDLTFFIYLDKGGILWITNESLGVDKLNLNKSPFTYYDLIIPPPQNKKVSATSFARDNVGNLWVGSFISGLFRFNSDLEFDEWYDFAPGIEKAYAINYIRFVFQDSRGVVWAGTSGGGLYVYDEDKNKFIHYQVNLSAKKDLDWAYRIFEDSRNTLWITMSSGVYFRKKDSDSLIDLRNVTDDPLSRITPYCIIEDSRGNIWIGTREKGVFQLTPENRENMQFINYTHNPEDPKSINNDVVLSVCNDDSGDLWIGTNTGLNKFNPQDTSFIKYDDKNGLAAHKMFHIESDNLGNLWLSTEKGLIRFNPSAELLLSRSKIYTLQDGLPFSGIYPYYFYRNKEGRIFVGGKKSSRDGFFCFYPDSLRMNPQPPPIVITDFKIQNKVIDFDTNICEIQQVHLKYNENFFSFEFAALDFVNPDKNQYAYMLEGYEDKWNHVGNRTFVNYTGVPPGEYIFRVIGSNNDDYWNEEGASIRIFIAPPFWKTWWAYLLYVILFLAILYSLRRYDLKRQQLKQDLELEHIQTEKLEELDRMKSQFFANISHEFRTPLTLILGPLKKIRQKIENIDLQKDLDIMYRNASRLHNLINQLLSLSKLESGKMKLQTKEENIVHLLNNFVQSFESLAKQKNISLIFKSTNKNQFIYLDSNKFEKIINNLLSNAFKFTGEGGEIRVSVTEFEPSSVIRSKKGLSTPYNKESRDIKNKGVIIEISDTGKGIPPGKLEHVFDRFYQVDDEDESDYEGTGIGLALTKELVELHGGKIWADSVPDSFTTFTVFLPLGKESDIPDESTEDNKPALDIDSKDYEKDTSSRGDEIPVSDLEVEEEEKHASGLPIVLIVEDNRDMRTFIRGYLDETYRIIEAENGEIGLKQAIDNIPDLIISDIMMPKMNGIEMCNKIKADERTSHIPLIMLTAKAGSESKIEGLETGADAYLTKPFDAEELLVRVRKLIEQRRKLREKFAQQLGTELPTIEGGLSVMDRKFLDKAKEVVERNLSDPEFSVVTFGKEMAMSRVQLHRKLSAIINLSASRFIRTLRLKKAAEMLADRTSNVSGVAYEVGFNNLSWFAKCFHEQYGISPSEYTNRKNH